MAILDIFSKRGKPLPDVFTYDELPETLRVQIVHVLRNSLGDRWEGWPDLARLIAAEHGLLALPGADPYERDFRFACLTYVLKAEAPLALDLIELAFRALDTGVRRNEHFHQQVTGANTSVDNAIDELNRRFRQNGVGYAYETDTGAIVRIDSQLIHVEAVKPALTLLRAKGFEGPNSEFLEAYGHFRHGRVEAAITEACKAFESTMKAICTARKWKFDPKHAAGQLIKTLADNGLIPTYSTEQLENVSKCLIGVATIRNKNAGHGAGATPRDVPDHYAAYALHLAASNIVFLIECHKAKS